MNLYLMRREKMSEVYSRKFCGEDLWVYIVFNGSCYDVYETKYCLNDDFLESFDKLSDAIEYADNLA